MIWPLLAASAVVISDADRKSFEDYRQCALLEARKAPISVALNEALEAAQKVCEMDYMAAALEMAADDFDNGRADNSDERLAVLQDALKKEASERRQAHTAQSVVSEPHEDQ